MKFKVGDVVHIKVFTAHLGIGVIVGPSKTNMGNNWMILIKGREHEGPHDVGSSWLKKLTKLERVLA